MSKTYPKQVSDCTIEFIDGEVKTYRLTAGPGIARFLAQDARDTGFLTLLNGRETCSVNIAHVRSFSLLEVSTEELDAEASEAAR